MINFISDTLCKILILFNYFWKWAILLLSTELCFPPNSYTEVLNPSTSESNHIEIGPSKW